MNEKHQQLRDKFLSLAKTYCGSAVKPGAIVIDDADQFNTLCDVVLQRTDPMFAMVEIERKDAMYCRFLVSSAFGWGFGDTIIEAKKKCRQQNPRWKGGVSTLVYRAKLVTQETTCDGAGGINYFPAFPPIELGEV